MDLLTTEEYAALTGKTGKAAVISAASEMISNFCGRDFQSKTHVEWKDGTASDFLLLNNYPVTQILAALAGEAEAAVVTYKGGGSFPSVCVTLSAVLLTDVVNGAKQTTTISFGTVATLSAVVAAVNATERWSASQSAGVDFPSVFLRGITSAAGGFNPVGFRVSLTFPDSPMDVQLDPNSSRMLRRKDAVNLFPAAYGDVVLDRTYEGFLRRKEGTDLFPRGTANFLVWYVAGYENTAAVPKELKAVAAQVAGELADLLEKGAFQSESLGDYSYTLARLETTDVMARNADALAKFKNHVI